MGKNRPNTRKGLICLLLKKVYPEIYKEINEEIDKFKTNEVQEKLDKLHDTFYKIKEQ